MLEVYIYGVFVTWVVCGIIMYERLRPRDIGDLLAMLVAQTITAFVWPVYISYLLIKKLLS